MKTQSLRALLILVGSMLINISGMQAGVSQKFEKFIGNEFSNFQGLYIIAGIVIPSLVIYLLVNHFGKDEEVKETGSSAHIIHNRRHHHRPVIKKTA